METNLSLQITNETDCLKDNPEPKISIHTVYAQRSPSFGSNEVAALIELIEEHKMVILNKSTSAAVNHMKDAVWIKIEASFNSIGFKHKRTAETLKTKWDNLKKEARKVSRNVTDNKYTDKSFSNSCRIAKMIRDAENMSNLDLQVMPMDHEDVMLSKKEEQHEIEKYSDQSEDDSDNKEDIESDKICRVNRSLNFTPEETKLLIQCVRKESKYVLSKDSSSRGNKLKRHAWHRIAKDFNQKSPIKRTSKVLTTKFTNMKRLARRTNLKAYIKNFKNKHHKLVDDCSKSVKTEPDLVLKETEELDDGYNDIDNQNDVFTDPLGTVLNGDSGTSSWASNEDKDIGKLKKDLLMYQLETAKLERQRLLDMIQAETLDREKKAIETSLRLRAARLEAITAEMKLPPSHPALVYTPQEAQAQQYIKNS